MISASRRAPRRITPSATEPPAQARSARCRSSTLSIACAPKRTIRSPSTSPARAAGLFGSTDWTSTAAAPSPWWYASRRSSGRRARADAEPRAAHAAVREQLAEHPRGGLDGDREADALRARDDRGVDAEHAAARVEQRAAGVARVERRGVLDDAVDQPVRRGRAACGRAPTRRRSTRSTRSRAGCRSRPRAGRRAARSSRRPAGTAPVSAARASTRTSARSVAGSSPTTERVERLAGRRAHAQRAPPRDDVAVRHHVAVGRDDEARAGAGRATRVAPDLEADDRRARALDDADHRARVGVEQVGVGRAASSRIGHRRAHAWLPTATSSVDLRAAARAARRFTVLPARSASASRSESGPVTASPSSASTMSPTSRPAVAAGPPSSRLATSAPRSRPTACASAAGSAAGYAPTPR